MAIKNDDYPDPEMIWRLQISPFIIRMGNSLIDSSDSNQYYDLNLYPNSIPGFLLKIKRGLLNK
jgi:hypothetical protein